MSDAIYKNRGLIPPLDNPKEYQMGGLSGVVHEERNTLKNWLNFLPSEERQKFRLFDSFGCTTYSCLNSIETQFEFLRFSKLIRNEDLLWLKNNGYMDANGKVNFDDRWIVVLSGTKPGVGNYMNAPWDAARKYGLVPQGATPFREDMTQKEYYNKSDFPPETYLLGMQFLKRFLIQYERIGLVDDQNLIKALGQAPVQIGLPTCSGWEGSPIINYCDYSANHGSMLAFMDKDYKYDFDSYPLFLKKLVAKYKIDFAYKGVISPVTSVGGQSNLRYVFHKNLTFGDYDNDVVQLCKRLIEEDCMESYFPPTPHYGVEIAQGVLNYWNKYRNVVSWWMRYLDRGKHFESRTRAHMNAGMSLGWLEEYKRRREGEHGN